jgi:hypothetical protein
MTMLSMHARGEPEHSLYNEPCDRLRHLVRPLGKGSQVAVQAVVEYQRVPAKCSLKFGDCGMCPRAAVGQREAAR